jgi:hypothetical protein
MGSNILLYPEYRTSFLPIIHTVHTVCIYTVKPSGTKNLNWYLLYQHFYKIITVIYSFIGFCYLLVS